MDFFFFAYVQAAAGKDFTYNEEWDEKRAESLKRGKRDRRRGVERERYG